MYVHMYIQGCSQLSLYAHSPTQCMYVCMYACMHYDLLYAAACRVGDILNGGTITACLIKNE